MKKLITLLCVASTIFLSTNALSASQEKLQKGGVCWASLGTKVGIEPSTQFNCDVIGKVTINQLYEKGYRVVTMLMHPQRTDIVSLIIEEQK